METKIANVLETTAALPTTFVSAEEGASLTRMLELEIEQVSEVAGGLNPVRCCAYHCCAYHC